MPGNKGFKGIDKRDYVAPDYNQRAGGMQSISGHATRRIDNQDAALSPTYTTYQLKAEDWQRMGVSASYSPESGSKLFHSPDTEFGASWNQRPVWSNCTVKVSGFKNRDEYASVSFRMGNCLNGNANGSWYGMGGIGPWSAMHRQQMGSTTAPEDHIPGVVDFPTTYTPMIGFWANGNNTLLIQVLGAGQGTINPCNEGDKVEIRIYQDGLIEYWHNDSKFVGPLYNAKLDLTQQQDPYWMFNIQSNQEGAAGNYMVYDVQMKGEITNHTAEGGICHNRYATQLNQTLLPISTSLWDSGSYSGALPTMVTSPDSGSCVVFDNGGYSSPIWTRQFVTGSGKGGIYTLTYPSASHTYGTIGEIVGLSDHSLVDGYNYYTQTLCVRTTANTWGSDTPGTNQYLDGWYAWNQAGTGPVANTRTGGANRQPVTSGSKWAFIITGSEASNIRLNGGTLWNDGGATDGAQQVAILAKLIDTTGQPINDYVSGNWMTISQSPYAKEGVGKGPKKLIFNDGSSGGKHYCDIRIGEQWIASGSL